MMRLWQGAGLVVVVALAIFTSVIGHRALDAALAALAPWALLLSFAATAGAGLGAMARIVRPRAAKLAA